MTASIRRDPFPVATPYRGIYSHGVEVPPGQRTLHVSGQIGIAPDGSLAPDFRGQCLQALRNIEAALGRAGARLEHVVRTRMYVTDIAAHWEAVGRAHGEFFGAIRPATSMVEVSRLIAPEMLVEIEADAIVTGE